MSLPMHSRGPAPKGRYAGIAAISRRRAPSASRNLVGSNTSGSDHAAMHDPRAHDDQRPRRDRDRPTPPDGEHVVLARPTCHEPRRRIQAQHLVQHRRCVRQSAYVVEGHGTIAAHVVDLGAHTVPHVGMRRQQLPGPRECRRHRLVPGDDERDDLVAHLPTGQRRPVVRVRREEQIEHVAWRGALGQRIRGPLGENRAHRRVECGHGPAEHEVVRRGHPGGAIPGARSRRSSPPSA